MSLPFPLVLKNFCSKKESKIERMPHINKLYGHSEIIIKPVFDWNNRINPTIKLEIPNGRKKTNDPIKISNNTKITDAISQKLGFSIKLIIIYLYLLKKFPAIIQAIQELL